MRKKFYITTAIDYPSGPPHIGHAYEKICADVIARWRRFKGEDVFFLTGTDEHGQKIARYAVKAGKEPCDFVDEMSGKFIRLCKRLRISYDDFIRTTQARHVKVAQAIFKKVYDKGEIYKGQYEGLYCVDCESFYLERDLKEGKCPIHGRPPESVKEDSYFFTMSKYQKAVLEHIHNNPKFIQPETRRAELINRIEEGVRDLSVSRSGFQWGIPLPMDEEHIIFVWFDALVNYISGVEYPGERFKKYWPADVHLIGKDILWFHGMVWPSILMAADIALPRQIFVHGFVNIGGEKLSKSKGTSIDPLELADRYGSDALRYFLIREISFGEDGDFSHDALIRRINSDLANDLGNLFYRTLTMVEKHSAGAVPTTAVDDGPDEVFEKILRGLPPLIDNHMSDFDFQSALSGIWDLVNRANKFIEESAPWHLKRTGETEKLSRFLYNLLEILRIVAIAISPFMPETAENMWNQLGIKQPLSMATLRDMESWGLMKAGTKVKKGKPLFPRIE